MLIKYRFLIGLAVVLLTLIILYRGVSSTDDGGDEEHPVVLTINKASNGLEATDDSKVLLHVKVFYEVLCPDSKHFIVQQLYPAWKKLKDLGLANLVGVELIPFGKASSRMRQGKYAFHCQHGEEECRLNRIHACLINNDSFSFDAKLDMIKCSMSRPAATLDCGLTECADGDALLHAAGAITNRDLGEMSFVPTITINQSQDGQRQLLKNFYGEIMQRLKDNGL